MKNIESAVVTIQAEIAKGMAMKMANVMFIGENDELDNKTKLVAQICSMFHHLKLDLEIANPDDITKGLVWSLLLE